MAVTIKEIAQAAGVSKAAVSKVLHDASNSVRVGEETATRIRAIATRLGYVPNLNARNLRFAKTGTIGIYFDDLAGIASGPLYTTHLLAGVCQVVFKRGYRVTLVSELDPTDAVQSLSDGRLDGVIWCRVVRNAQTLRALANSPIPVVTMGCMPTDRNDRLGSVACDNAGGLNAAVRHLYDLGHRDIAFVYESREEEASDCTERRNAYLDAMRALVLEPRADRTLAWSWELDEFESWRQSNPDCTAIIGWSERCAGRLIGRCQELGIDVPGELSIVGFDSTPYCDTTRPTLTAVRQPIIGMATEAASLLLDMVEDKPIKAHTITLSCPLDIRGSTSSPPLR